MFGFFGASSWWGMGLWQIASNGYSPSELNELRAAGTLDEMVVKLNAFSRPSQYHSYGYRAESPASALSADDLNNIHVPAISRVYGRNARRLIAHAPKRYMGAVGEAYELYCMPSSRYKHLLVNAEKISLHERVYADYLQGTAVIGSMGKPWGTFLYVVLPLALILYVVQFGVRCRGKGWDLERTVRDESVLLWMFVMIVYTTVVSCTMEIGENDRFKFLVEIPICVFVLVVYWRIWARSIRKLVRREKATTSSG
jgi:hypothetical protein